MEVVTLRVSSKSNPNKVGSSIVWMEKEGKQIEVQGIGNGAVGQSTKAVAIANGFVEKEGYKFISEPVWVDLVVDGKERSGIKLVLTKVKREEEVK